MRIPALLCISSLVVGCTTDDPTDDDVDVAETEQAVTCPAPAIDTNRSLVVTDPVILAKFSFQRVMNKIN